GRLHCPHGRPQQILPTPAPHVHLTPHGTLSSSAFETRDSQETELQSLTGVSSTLPRVRTFRLLETSGVECTGEEICIFHIYSYLGREARYGPRKCTVPTPEPLPPPREAERRPWIRVPEACDALSTQVVTDAARALHSPSQPRSGIKSSRFADRSTRTRARRKVGRLVELWVLFAGESTEYIGAELHRGVPILKPEDSFLTIFSTARPGAPCGKT
ncbi:hypothetical protein BZA05DRAFT_468193, partial [Tricharina praecox]|uniref:uncharacterized protein n=1 Tax=Tricharina praecox TaxID=43433 RepID=UPI00221FC80C